MSLLTGKFKSTNKIIKTKSQLFLNNTAPAGAFKAGNIKTSCFLPGATRMLGLCPLIPKKMNYVTGHIN
jgi:hypothetical protein